MAITDEKTIGDNTRKRLQDFWKPYKYLIIDEISTISKRLLAQIERNISIGKACGTDVARGSFGGISVILCGDFHHFLPVATSPEQALFHANRANDDSLMQIGRTLYEEFTKVVILRKVQKTNAGKRSCLAGS